MLKEAEREMCIIVAEDTDVFATALTPENQTVLYMKPAKWNIDSSVFFKKKSS